MIPGMDGAFHLEILDRYAADVAERSDTVFIFVTFEQVEGQGLAVTVKDACEGIGPCTDRGSDGDIIHQLEVRTRGVAAVFYDKVGDLVPFVGILDQIGGALGSRSIESQIGRILGHLADNRAVHLLRVGEAECIVGIVRLHDNTDLGVRDGHSVAEYDGFCQRGVLTALHIHGYDAVVHGKRTAARIYRAVGGADSFKRAGADRDSGSAVYGFVLSRERKVTIQSQALSRVDARLQIGAAEGARSRIQKREGFRMIAAADGQVISGIDLFVIFQRGVRVCMRADDVRLVECQSVGRRVKTRLAVAVDIRAVQAVDMPRAEPQIIVGAGELTDHGMSRVVPHI